MGCDIHAFTEKFVDGHWQCLNNQALAGRLSDTFDARSYSLFGLLAQVRYDMSHGWDPRGLPPGVSLEIQNESNIWDVDGHSHSWQTLKELQEKATELLISPLDKEHQWALADLRDLIDHIKRHPVDDVPSSLVRLVYWFDN